EKEEIVFDEVYPLYGLSDIRGSSTHRVQSIQSDLIQQLNQGVKLGHLLTLVSAAAGFGKTTLVSNLVKRSFSKSGAELRAEDLRFSFSEAAEFLD
ncbi:MAG: hypothetical protein R3293_27375, partial [Candidatus Promineifilaceae bacterium]|nr:hypothetical protein [Candidatus Promineifilaceae bacterium]